ncbi:hypothetical protein Ciccas_005229 [Cichlidogyrus casuarinus]|uniref:Gag protein n=1 Tax=Cichlidogyrus casuarinus TaxID=1844966 RepID=A0ABD2Q998_9PLAT
MAAALKETEIAIGIESWLSFLDDLAQFQWTLDLRVQGDFAPICRWLQKGEKWRQQAINKWRLTNITNSANALRPENGVTPGTVTDLLQLIEEGQTHFAGNKAERMARDAMKAARQLKDTLPGQVMPPDQIPLAYADQIQQRLAVLKDAQCGCAETLKAALARRQFANILHGTRDIPSGRIPALNENEGLLLAMKRFELLASGKYPNERAEDVLSTLSEVQVIHRTNQSRNFADSLNLHHFAFPD